MISIQRGMNICPLVKGAVRLLLLTLLVGSCGSKEKTPLVFVEMDSPDTAAAQVPLDASSDNDDVEEVPFTESSGVKFIDVNVNGQMTLKMILDSGCSTTLISLAEANYLYQKGCITEDDILGLERTQIADGSIVENMVIHLRSLTIADKVVCPNVTALVSANVRAPLLLGNDVLNRTPQYSVDNERKVIIFRLR